MSLLPWFRLILCCCFFSPLALLAQDSHLAEAAAPIPALDNYFKESLNTRDGLPHNTINAIAQTPDGYLWFGTWEGVARYNGREFKIYDRSPLTGLPDVGVRTFHLDRHQALWVAGSRGGLVKIKDGIWQAQPPLGVLINRVLLDSQDRLWLATEGKGLYRQNPDGSRIVLQQTDGLPSDQVHSLLEDQAGRIWIGTSDGLVFLDQQLQLQQPSAVELHRTPVFALTERENELLVGTERGLYSIATPTSAAETLLANVPVSALLQESRDLLWIGTVDRGLLRQRHRITEQLDIRQGLPNNRILALLQDNEKSLWVGTNGGVFRLRDAPFTTFTTEQGLAGNFIRTVLSHSDGCMYIGSSRGLNQYCKGQLKQLDLSAVSIGQSILSLAEGPDGSLWAGTYADGLIQLQQGQIVQHYHAGNLLPANEVRAILPLADGKIWVGTALGAAYIDNGTAQYFSREHGLPSPFIMALYQSADQRIFIGSGAGVAVLKPDGSLQRLNLQPFDDADYAFGFAEDTQAGILWMTTDRGLLAYDLANDQIRMIGRAQGMPFDKLFQLVLDQQGYFWISSNRGVLRLERQVALDVIAGRRGWVDIELYGESDGMASAQANGGSMGAAALYDDGSVWVATSMGVSRVQPERLQRFARITPPVVIEELAADGTDYAVKDGHQLAAGTNRIEIHYAGLGYVMSQRIQYRTLLEGFDLQWVNRGSSILAEYTNLPPGDYRFRVAAAYPGGDWSKNEAVLTFTVLPHLWQRGWFQLLLLAILAGSLILGIRWRLGSLQRSELRLRKLVAEQTAELQLLARQDALTGLANRRAFDEALQHEYQRAQRYHTTLCLALLDVDHFKRVNDQLSHAVGDEVLKRVAAVLKQQSRSIDLLARWGGEEFAILLPDTSLEDATEVCERLRHKVERLDLNDIAPDLHITISIGLTTNYKLDLSQLLLHADQALYQAKRDGRNLLVIAGQPNKNG
jgi:diguanylate cyclase (GGDEF)-like protein